MKQNKKFYTLLILLIIFQIIRCFSCGRVYRDEQYYVSLGYRFATGTRMFVDDYGIAQMMGFIIAPLIKLFLLVFNNTDGIILYVRICYVIMTIISSILIYKRFNKESNYAWLASLVFFIFTPLSIMSLSYNTMAINFLIQSLCLFDIKDNKKIKSIISGVLFALSVLCNPYMAMLYLLSFIYILTKEKDTTIKTNFYFSLIGICVIGTVFIGYVFIGNNIGVVISPFKNLIDPSHSNSKIAMLLMSLSQFKDAFSYFILVQGIISVISCFKEDKALDIINTILSIVCIAYYFIFSRARIYAGGYSMILTSIMLVVLPKLIHRKDVVRVYFLIFLFQGFCFLLSSNVGARVISNPFINILVLYILCLDEYKLNKNLHLALIIITGIVLFGCRAYLDNSMQINYECQISGGPFKYLYTYKDARDSYVYNFDRIKKLSEYKDCDNIYIVTDDCWYFLTIEDKNVINYSTFQYYPTKESYISMFNIYMNNHEVKDYYILVMFNDLGIDINDFKLDNVKYIDDLEIGKLYLVK